MDAINEKEANILRVADTEQLAERALEVYIDSCRQAVESRGFFFTAISGGHTPELFYKKLAQHEVYSQLDWNKVHLFWVDERCVQPTGQASNFGMAERTFLHQVPIPPENIHRVSGETENYREAAVNYETDIRQTMQLQPGQISPIIRTGEGYRILKVISKEPAGQRTLEDPRVQQTIRETLLNRKDTLLKSAYYEMARNEAKVVNYYAASILDKARKGK